MNLETLASLCSGLEVDFPGKRTVSLDMGTVETRSSKTLASSPESDKTKSPKEKILNLTEVSTKKREDSEAVVDAQAVVGQENGISDLGKAEAIGEMGVSGEKKDLEIEENGISLGENESKIDGVVSESEDGEVEDKSDEGHEFCVGDFVWGKVKSHPWWPGQIYDPSNVSELAAKIKRKGKHLVAYFGDGTFAWCQSSQLKPFEDNFDEMSKQSGTKTFVAAVQQAVDEVGRVIELKMTCSCVSEENKGQLVRLVAENAGVKEGSLVPEGKIRRFSNVLDEPSDLLAVLKRIAQAVHLIEVVELSVLIGRVSAFYRAKGVCELPRYYDPVLVPGLEDISEATVEIPAQGPFDDWVPTLIDVSLTRNDQPVLQSCPSSSENKRTPRRKQRSIADLIAQAKASAAKKAPDSVEKKRKRGEDLDVDVNSSLATLSQKAKKTRPSSGSLKKDLTGKGKKETKESVASKGGKTEKQDNADSEKEDGGDKAANSENLKGDDSSVKALFEKSPSFRERKKSKYLSPPFTDVNSSKRKKDAETELPKDSAEDGERQVNATSANEKVGPKKLENKDIAESSPGEETSHGLSAKQKTPSRNQDKIGYQKKTDVSTNELLSEVRSTAANPFTERGKKSAEMVSDFISVYRDSVYCNGSKDEADSKSQPRKRKRKASESGTVSKKKEPKQPVDDDKSPKAKKSRSSATDESNGKKNVETRGRKRKQETSASESKKKTGKGTVNKSEGKQAVKTLDILKSPSKGKKKPRTAILKEKKTKDKDTIEEKTLPATLIVEFAPASSLPTKADLIRMYAKYGDLDEVKTDMYYANQCARVYFLNSSEAETAFRDSKSASPFGSTSVEFVLECPSHEYKTRVLEEISSKTTDKSPKKPSKSRGNDDAESGLGFVKRKLEMISSMLEDKDGKMSPIEKSKLKGEISGLLEKVSSMVGPSA